MENNNYIPFPLNTCTRPQSWAYWRGGIFNEFEKLNQVIEICEALEKKPGEIGSGAQGKELELWRVSNIAWLNPTETNAWIYTELAKVIRELNKEYFGFHLSGLEYAQYTVYDTTGSHYDWHTDDGQVSPSPQRKLSLTWQLSDPFEYEGGELQIWGKEKAPIPREKGLVTVFPSTTLHRVTPVTSGIRRSLVVWAVGPQLV